MNQDWTRIVRAAIPRCAEPFSAPDVCRAANLEPQVHRCPVADVLTRLALQGELDAIPTKAGKRPRYAYKRTAAFQGGAPIDFEAQREAAAFLQSLGLAWASARLEADRRAKEARNAAAE